ncbi:hypothetical protein M7I_7831 [Glarea lozoyensis 74030]|uniref:Uncharacterized protein n=1 Tax=Glarea lozoyensis (strain ATCC 74030 / MF5533) TaxID=1104152 RepID=H0EYD2_GLAL7|nr:hypothetical protein M7I_7831 [Glarea lozoyensis 74030]
MQSRLLETPMRTMTESNKDRLPIAQSHYWLSKSVRVDNFIDRNS